MSAFCRLGSSAGPLERFPALCLYSTWDVFLATALFTRHHATFCGHLDYESDAVENSTFDRVYTYQTAKVDCPFSECSNNFVSYNALLCKRYELSGLNAFQLNRRKLDDGLISPLMSPTVDVQWLQDKSFKSTFEVHGSYVVYLGKFHQ